MLALTLPLTIGCEFFARDVVRVLLGAKWMEALPVFRWLAPPILVFAIANTSSGHVERLMKMSLVIAPILLLGYVIGVPYGPIGVAYAYSTVMVVWLFPLIAWAMRGTEISFAVVLRTIWPPLTASFFSGLLASGTASLIAGYFPPLRV